MTPTIEQVIAAIPEWAGRSVSADRIPAGLTNTNYRVVVDGTPYFVRIPGASTELLAVDRGNELHNTLAAAAAGVAPRVAHSLPEWQVFVLDWLPATHDVERGVRRARACRRGSPTTLRRLHARAALPRRLRHVPPEPSATSRLVDERAIRDPGRLPRAPRPRSPSIEAALARAPAAARPVPQRPAGRERTSTTGAAVDRRLRVQRQRTTRPSSSATPARSSASTPDQVAELCRRLLRRGHAGAARPDAAPDDHVRRRLDAVGGHPGAHLDDRLRLRGLGRGALGARHRRCSTAPTSGRGWRRSDLPGPTELVTTGTPALAGTLHRPDGQSIATVVMVPDPGRRTATTTPTSRRSATACSPPGSRWRRSTSAGSAARLATGTTRARTSSRPTWPPRSPPFGRRRTSIRPRSACSGTARAAGSSSRSPRTTPRSRSS